MNGDVQESRARRGSRSGLGAAGFTLIELLVVMAIIATLGSIAVPRYFNSLEKTREVALRSNLKVIREAIDQFHQDTGKLPASLEELVKNRYLRELPVDPMTGDAGTWTAVRQTATRDNGIIDVRSGAQGTPKSGGRYDEW